MKRKRDKMAYAQIQWSVGSGFLAALISNPEIKGSEPFNSSTGCFISCEIIPEG